MRTRKLMSAVSVPGLLGAYALTAIATGGAYAQEAEAAAEAETIVVWGTAVSADSLYLGEQEIAVKQADHLSDLLRTIPGVDVGGTHSVNSRINVRGLDDRALNVYIDGALQTNYLYHHIGNLLINPDILKSADLQLGAHTVTAGGLGGVVRFETKDAADLLAVTGNRFGGRVMGSYNDNAQYGLSLTGYGQLTDQIDGLVYFNRIDRDNFEDGSGRATIGSDGTTDNALAKVGFDLTANQRIEVSYDRLFDSGDYTQRPDMGVLTNEAITGDILIPTEYTRETINASYQLDLGDALMLDATYYTNDMSLWRDETNPLIPRSPRVRREVTADNQGVNILAETYLGTGMFGHTFRYGAEWFDQNLDFLADLDAGTAPIRQAAESTAFFIEDEIAIGDNLIVRPGVRQNEYTIDYLNTGESGSWDEFTYGVAGEAMIAEGFWLLASYTELFRGPEPAEPFGGGGANKIVNPGLAPETGDNVEFGVRFSREIDGARINLGANVFTTSIDDFIGETAVPGSTTGETWDVNVGTAEVEGWEASANFQVNNWDFLLTYATSEFDASGLTTTALTETVREVGDSVSFDFSYAFPSTGIRLSWNGVLVDDADTQLAGAKPGYTVHNLSARWDEAFGVPGFAATLGVDNVFDETYTSHASRTGETFHPVFGPLVLNDVEPGRNFKLTLAKAF